MDKILHETNQDRRSNNPQIDPRIMVERNEEETKYIVGNITVKVGGLSSEPFVRKE